jgi:hypothetical protein
MSSSQTVAQKLLRQVRQLEDFGELLVRRHSPEDFEVLLVVRPRLGVHDRRLDALASFRSSSPMLTPVVWAGKRRRFR